jgi:hypothetical protein
VNLNEYRDTIEEKMLAFTRWWNLKSIEDPNVFPFDMGHADWEEQFEMADIDDMKAEIAEIEAAHPEL